MRLIRFSAQTAFFIGFIFFVVAFEPFDMAAVFAYLCKLEMQQRWAKLDVEQGKETFQKIIDDLRSEARVPEEFVAPTVHRQI